MGIEPWNISKEITRLGNLNFERKSKRFDPIKDYMDLRSPIEIINDLKRDESISSLSFLKLDSPPKLSLSPILPPSPKLSPSSILASVMNNNYDGYKDEKDYYGNFGDFGEEGVVHSSPSFTMTVPSLTSSRSSPSRNRSNRNNDGGNNNNRRNRSRIDILLERKKQLDSEKRPRSIDSNSYTKDPLRIKDINISDIKINLTGILNLGNTIINSLGNGEIVVYSNNKLFTLENVNGNKEEGYFLNYKGKDFRLEESENLIRFEEDFLERNREDIKEFQTKNLDKLSKEYGRLREKILDFRDSLNRDFSLEEFISDYIFALHHHKKINPSQKYENIKLPQSGFKKSEVKKISFSGARKSVLEGLVEEFGKGNNKKLGGIAFMSNGVYSLPLASENSRRRKQINLEESFYISSINDFERKYKEKLSEEIKNKVKKSFSLEILKIKDFKEKIQELNKKTRRRINNRKGSVGFDKKSNNEYIVFRSLPQYIMKKNSNYYLFPSVKIGDRIIKKNRDLSFTIPGFVYKTLNYHHPFVYDSENIEQNVCHGSGYRSPLRIKKTSYKISNLNKKEFAISVLKVLDLLEGVLERGYTKRTTPVHELGDFSMEKITESKARRLERLGVKIHDNDKKTI